MISEENLTKLYEDIINGEELTNESLSKYNLNLADLINQNIIEQTEEGNYNFLAIDDLYLYGKKLIDNQNYKKAISCFEKCYKMNNNHYETCLQLFFINISERNYKNSFKYLNSILNIDNPYYKTDVNFYLYLLSLIIELPDIYREYTKNLSLEDIRIDSDDKRYKEVSLQTRARFTAMKERLSYAFKQSLRLTEKYDTPPTECLIINTLLSQAYEEQIKNKSILVELLKEKNYDEMKTFLEFKRKKQKLSLSDTYTYKLTNIIINLKRTKIIPETTLFKTENIYKAIDDNNFALALEISQNHSARLYVEDSKNTILILLKDICDIVKEITKNNEYLENKLKNVQKKEIKDSNITNNDIIEKKQNAQIDSSFSDLLSYLMNSDIEKALISLKNYMNLINKTEYEFLIIDLIKLSVIENDKAFTKPMTVLSQISRDDFKFDVSCYIQEFYISLSNKKINEAKIYIDIITKANDIGQKYISPTPLLQAIDKLEEASKNNKISKTHDKINKQSKNQNVIIETKEKSKINSNNDTSITNDQFSFDKEFIKTKHELLLENDGIILLKPMNSERRKYIHSLVEKYRDMVSFSIGEENNRQIVLRYKPFVNGHVDIKKLARTGNQAYREERYEDCIENYMKLLHYNKPRAFVYAMLGLAYMKKNENSLAIIYLTVATELSKTEENRLDFNEIIELLKHPTDKFEQKPDFEMQVNDFYDDTKDDYGIKNIDKITSYILKTGLDVETACKKLNLTDEQIDIVRLIYAKTYYIQGNYEKGDQFFKVVEKSKNKTKFTNKLLDEIRRNKKFYINRAGDNVKTLSLALQPKK